MKRFLVIFLLMIYACSYCALAASVNDISREAKASFNVQYPGALYAKWETMESDHIYLVRFVFNNLAYVAYYKEDGTALGFARIVTVESLPAKVKLVVDSLSAGYDISCVQELVLQDTHLFYFNIVKDQCKKLISIYCDGKVKKTSKCGK
jgi:hypothetical protein